MGLFSRNRNKESSSQNREPQVPATDEKRLLDEFKNFSFWSNSSELNAMKSILEKMETEKNLDKKEELNERLGKLCNKYIESHGGTKSEDGKQKVELAQKVLGYQQFSACEVYHDQIKAMDNQMVSLESAMKITSYSRKFQDAYHTFHDSPNKSVVNIDRRNLLQKQYENHLEINVDAVRSKSKLQEAIRQNKPWGQISFPVPLVNSFDGAEKVGNALSAKSVVTVNGKKGVFSEYVDVTLDKVAENCISALPPGDIQNALGNHFEDIVGLFKKLETIHVDGGKESTLIEAKGKIYTFMNEKLEQGNLQKQKEKYQDLIEVIETPEFDNILLNMTDRAREFSGVEKAMYNENFGKLKKGDLDKRHELTSRMAEALGLEHMVAHSERIRMVRNGKVVEGNFMEFAEGYDVKSGDEEKRKVLAEAVLDDPGFQRDANRMEVFDYLCGQGDRHDGNMIYTVGEPGNDGKRRITGFKGIDNDLSFITSTHVGGERNVVRDIEYIPAIDKELADTISQLDRKQLQFYLGDVLDKSHIDALEERLNNIKTHCKTCPMIEKEEWEKNVPAVEALQKSKGGVYAGIKVFNHLLERMPSPTGYKTQVKQEADNAKKSLKSQAQKYHEKITKPELTANKATRLQMDVKDLEKEVFRDIETRKKEFHNKRAAVPQNTAKTHTHQARVMGK